MKNEPIGLPCTLYLAYASTQSVDALKKSVFLYISQQRKNNMEDAQISSSYETCLLSMPSNLADTVAMSSCYGDSLTINALYEKLFEDPCLHNLTSCSCSSIWNYFFPDECLCLTCDKGGHFNAKQAHEHYLIIHYLLDNPEFIKKLKSRIPSPGIFWNDYIDMSDILSLSSPCVVRLYYCIFRCIENFSDATQSTQFIKKLLATMCSDSQSFQKLYQQHQKTIEKAVYNLIWDIHSSILDIKEKEILSLLPVKVIPSSLKETHKKTEEPVGTETLFCQTYTPNSSGKNHEVLKIGSSNNTNQQNNVSESMEYNTFYLPCHNSVIHNASEILKNDIIEPSIDLCTLQEIDDISNSLDIIAEYIQECKKYKLCIVEACRVSKSEDFVLLFYSMNKKAFYYIPVLDHNIRINTGSPIFALFPSKHIEKLCFQSYILCGICSIFYTPIHNIKPIYWADRYLFPDFPFNQAELFDRYNLIITSPEIPPLNILYYLMPAYPKILFIQKKMISATSSMISFQRLLQKETLYAMSYYPLSKFYGIKTPLFSLLNGEKIFEEINILSDDIISRFNGVIIEFCLTASSDILQKIWRLLTNYICFHMPRYVASCRIQLLQIYDNSLILYCVPSISQKVYSLTSEYLLIKGAEYKIKDCDLNILFDPIRKGDPLSMHGSLTSK